MRRPRAPVCILVCLAARILGRAFLLASFAGRRAVLAKLVLPELPVQRRAIHPEDAGRRTLIAVGSLERLEDRLPFDLGQCELAVIDHGRLRCLRLIENVR